MRMSRKGRVLLPLLALALLGAAAPAAHGSLSWNTTSYDFGEQEAGVSTVPVTFTLTATCDPDGGGCVDNNTFGAVTAPGADFGIDSTDCAGVLTPPSMGSTSCTARVNFKPSSTGAKTGVLDTATGPDVFLGGKGVDADGKSGAGKKCKRKKKKGKSSASAAKKKKKCKKKKKK